MGSVITGAEYKNRDDGVVTFLMLGRHGCGGEGSRHQPSPCQRVRGCDVFPMKLE